MLTSRLNILGFTVLACPFMVSFYGIQIVYQAEYSHIVKSVWESICGTRICEPPLSSANRGKKLRNHVGLFNVRYSQYIVIAFKGTNYFAAFGKIHCSLLEPPLGTRTFDIINTLSRPSYVSHTLIDIETKVLITHLYILGIGMKMIIVR